MLFLSSQEIESWKVQLSNIENNNIGPGCFKPDIRPNLLPVFYFYVGTYLLAHDHDHGIDWIREGTLLEDRGFHLNAFMMGFLKRNNNVLKMPGVIFEDPLPYVHFTGLPVLQKARASFTEFCCNTLSEMKGPLRLMDLGCGNGTLTVRLIKELLRSKKSSEIGEILLVDSSAGMLELAEKEYSSVFGNKNLRCINSKIQDAIPMMNVNYDIAVSSLAYHHMPYDEKEKHLKSLSALVDNFIILEVDANNDTPELHSPELALAVYQAYTRLIDFIFSHDTSVKTAIDCVDLFLMSEVISFMIHSRGIRTDYHMLSNQWKGLFEKSLKGFSMRGHSNVYSDDYLNIFCMHYAKDR